MAADYKKYPPKNVFCKLVDVTNSTLLDLNVKMAMLVGYDLSCGLESGLLVQYTVWQPF